MFGLNHPTSKLDHEIAVMTRRLEKLKRKAARESRYGFKHLKSEAENFFDHSADHWQHLTDEGRKMGKHAKKCVEQHPGVSLAVGVGALAVLGCLLFRR